jgi:hypothetical protein
MPSLREIQEPLKRENSQSLTSALHSGDDVVANVLNAHLSSVSEGPENGSLRAPVLPDSKIIDFQVSRRFLFTRIDQGASLVDLRVPLGFPNSNWAMESQAPGTQENVHLLPEITCFR